MKKFFLIGLVILTAVTLHANPRNHANYGNAFVDRVYTVFDGDSFRCDIKGYPPIIGRNVKVKIAGVYTSEIRHRNKYATKKFTINYLNRAKRIELRNMKRDKFFGIIADVFVDGRNLANLLMRKEYHHEN